MFLSVFAVFFADCILYPCSLQKRRNIGGWNVHLATVDIRFCGDSDHDSNAEIFKQNLLHCRRAVMQSFADSCDSTKLRRGMNVRMCKNMFNVGQIAMADKSVVEYIMDTSGHSCGYCHSSNTKYRHGLCIDATMCNSLCICSWCLFGNCRRLLDCRSL